MKDEKIVFSDHAEDKFKILKKHGFEVTKEIVISAMKNPDKIEMGYKNRKVAQIMGDVRAQSA